MASYYKDVCSQPAALRGCAEGLRRGGAEARLKALCGRGYTRVIFAGMGSSNYCAIPADLFLCAHGVDSARWSASELLHYRMGALDGGTLLVLNSQSGESAEIVRLLERLPGEVPVAAVTNDPDSTLARRANWVFPMDVEEEEAVTTRTFVAAVAIDLLIARSLTGASFGNFFLSLLKACKDMETTLAEGETIRKTLWDALGAPPQLAVLGRGCSLCSVQAGALFLREIVKYPAFGELCGEFRHGPMEMVDGGFSGIILGPEDATAPLQRALAADIRAKGGRIVYIGNVELKGIPSVILPKTEEWLSPLTTILPIQIYADALAGARGVEAGKFRWGSKITKIE